MCVDVPLFTSCSAHQSANREEDVQRSFEQWLAGALPRDAPASRIEYFIGTLRWYARQQHLRDELAQSLENLGYDANTINAGFEQARSIAPYPVIWDRVLVSLLPNSDAAAATPAAATRPSASDQTTSSYVSSLTGSTTGSSPPRSSLSTNVLSPTITADRASLWSTRETVGSAPSVPSLPIPIREDVVGKVPKPPRIPDDRIPPGDSFSDPTKDQVSGASREGVASNETKSPEAGDELQPEEWGVLAASYENASNEVSAEGVQFQEAGEVVASNEMASQVAENGIQFQEAGEVVASNEMVSQGAENGIQFQETGEVVASNEMVSQVAENEIQFQEEGEVVASNEMVSQEAENGIQFQEAGEAVAFNEITSHEGGGIQSHEVLPAIQSGATASPSGNVSATNSCCIIL